MRLIKSARSVTGVVAAAAAVLSLALAPMVSAQDMQMAPAAPAAPPPLDTSMPTVSESVAAIINDDIISTYDLVQRMRLLAVTSGIQPSAETLPQLQREALRSLIDERLQFQELRRVEKQNKIQIIADDKEVDAEIDDVARSNNMTGEQLIGQLRAQGAGAETFREQIRAEISWQGYIRGRFGSRLRIGQDQVKATLERLAASASKPQYQISEVFIDANTVGGPQVALQGAQQLVDQMQRGAPFPAVARQFSASPTAASGGDAGWISTGEMSPEVDAALGELRPGQLSAPIVTQDGVYIIYLRDKRGGSSTTLVSLKQIAVPLPADATPDQLASAQGLIESVRPRITGCADLEASAAGVAGLMAGDLGEAELGGLTDDFQAAVNSTPDGQLSQPIRTQAGLHLVMVCSRRQSGAQLPTAEQVESRLFSQQLTMISKRQLRDLRNVATIETR